MMTTTDDLPTFRALLRERLAALVNDPAMRMKAGGPLVVDPVTWAFSTPLGGKASGSDVVAKVMKKYFAGKRIDHLGWDGHVLSDGNFPGDDIHGMPDGVGHAALQGGGGILSSKAHLELNTVSGFLANGEADGDHGPIEARG